jgi:DNA primase catalytic core, N-terminal domain
MARTGRLIDRFRDRVVFPIIHEGQVLGFVGRRHPDLTDADRAGPKYLNTGDTQLFHKEAQRSAPSRTSLRGRHPGDRGRPNRCHRRHPHTGQGRYIGVAPLATSLTEEQAHQLARIGTQPIVATDADLAARSPPNVTFGCSAATGSTPSTPDFPTAPTQPTGSPSQARQAHRNRDRRPTASRTAHRRNGWPTCHPPRRCSKQPGSSPPGHPATGTRAARPSVHESVYRQCRLATPYAPSPTNGTPTHAELHNNRCRPSARSNAEYQGQSNWRLSIHGRLPQPSRPASPTRPPGSGQDI